MNENDGSISLPPNNSSLVQQMYARDKGATLEFISVRLVRHPLCNRFIMMTMAEHCPFIPTWWQSARGWAFSICICHTYFSASALCSLATMFVSDYY